MPCFWVYLANEQTERQTGLKTDNIWQQEQEQQSTEGVESQLLSCYQISQKTWTIIT